MIVVCCVSCLFMLMFVVDCYLFVVWRLLLDCGCVLLCVVCGLLLFVIYRLLVVVEC